LTVDALSAQGCGALFDSNACGADLTAIFAVHETGHMLGLNHVTESTGENFDPLSDTPKCPCSICATGSALANCGNSSAPTEMTNQMCVNPTFGCGGGDNLMFWLAPNRGFLSPNQGEVMRGNMGMR
jgi:hypothetical protein